MVLLFALGRRIDRMLSTLLLERSTIAWSCGRMDSFCFYRLVEDGSLVTVDRNAGLVLWLLSHIMD